MIKVKDVQVRFGETTVLESVSMEVKKGELVLLIGDNGTGKSTLLKTLAGRNETVKGYIGIDAPFVYHQQNFPLLHDMTVIENIQMLAHVLGIKYDSEQLEALLQRLNLTEQIKQNIESLSGGQRQRLGLLLTMLRDREIFLIDEADSAMDPKGRSLYNELLLELRAKGKSVLFISHHTKESMQIADSCYVLVDGSAKRIDPKRIDSDNYKLNNSDFVKKLEKEAV